MATSVGSGAPDAMGRQTTTRSRLVKYARDGRTVMALIRGRRRIGNEVGDE